MVRVRFAPSPTGNLHVGNARTALINYLFASSREGMFILRIEDTDVERSEARFEDSILQDLRWLGLDWNEGPYRQSDRLDIYRLHARTLLDQGGAYRCFCTKEELEATRAESIRRGEPPRYKGTCRSLPEGTARKLEEEGRPFVLRFRSLQQEITFSDEIHGEMRFPADHVDDFIIVRQDTIPSYNFAAAVDDMLMEVTHVIRGSDHLSNTPKQIMILLAFGKKPPSYAHHALLMGEDRKPLSKRHGATRIEEFRTLGILPEAMVNYLAIVGRNVTKELLDREELLRDFSLSSFSPSDSVFDMEKLLWLNKEYLRSAPPGRLLVALGLPVSDREKVAVLRENARTLEEIRLSLDIFDSATIDEECLQRLAQIKELEGMLPFLYRTFAEDGNTDFDRVFRAVSDETHLPRKELLMLLRMIVTGRRSGPPLREVFQLVPKEFILKRIACVEKRLSPPSKA